MSDDVYPAPTNFDAALEAARGRGEHRFDPVRFRFIESLARRASGHGGAARRLLDQRVGSLLQAYTAEAEAARTPQATEPTRQEAPAAASVLGELLRHFGDPVGPGAHAGTGELKTLRYFRSTWSRLHANQRLTQSLAKVPEQAGPLNSQHLVHRTLSVLHDLSPGYLDRFMAYVDALSWLEQVQVDAAPAAKEGARAEKRAGRRKQG